MWGSEIHIAPTLVRSTPQASAREDLRRKSRSADLAFSEKNQNSLPWLLTDLIPQSAGPQASQRRPQRPPRGPACLQLCLTKARQHHLTGANDLRLGKRGLLSEGFIQQWI